jgi:hypothetical protein
MFHCNLVPVRVRRACACAKLRHRHRTHHAWRLRGFQFNDCHQGFRQHGGGGGSPGGSNGQVQFNNAGSFGGLSNVQPTAFVQQFSSTLPGAVPASGGGTANFLRADGTFAAPPIAPVSSVFGRTGAVVATSGDYNAGQVTYTPPGTGGVATNVQAEVQRYGVWANDFGALCSGGGNDLTAFQSAINAAQTLAVPMKFSGAACVVSGTLNITAAIDMSGQFKNSVLYNSNLANNLIVINTTSAVYLHDFNMIYTPSAANSG